MSHNLPELSYAYNALEPHYDAQTVEIHHSRHHQTYVDKLNVGVLACRKAMPDLERLTDAIPLALKELQDAAEQVSTAVEH